MLDTEQYTRVCVKLSYASGLICEDNIDSWLSGISYGVYTGRV